MEDMAYRKNRQPQLSAVVQTGPSRFIRESDEGGRKAYRVEADVLEYFGLVPKPGAIRTHARGVCSSGESWESIEQRNQYPSGIYGYRGPVSGYPYVGY